jgi:hypothetical protein
MALLKKSRLVTFRVSVEEYDEFCKWCQISGARSISDFARAAVRQNVESLRVPATTLSGDLITLSRALSQLDAELDEVRARIRSVLGPTGSEGGKKRGLTP